MKDFFVSYTERDKCWAEWIAWVLEEEGYSTVIQAWDFRPGSNFVIRMQESAVETTRTIAVLSRHYVDSSFTQAEWSQAFARDPKGETRDLIPVRVDDCDPPGMLGQIVYVDIATLSESDARTAIINAIPDRGKPSERPTYPGGSDEIPTDRSVPTRAEFPGTTTQSSKLTQPQDTKSPWQEHVVMSLHGIRTRGKWQKELTRELNKNHLTHIPLDFGFFQAIQLLIPSQRRKKIGWFRDQYTILHTEGAPPSIVAHSFGTYLIARAMELYPEVQFSRIIFCGSIVDRNYPWSPLFDDGRCQAVLNDYGSLDIWATAAKYGIKDAGDSGVSGFTDEANGRVIQRHHPEFGHSDYFYDLNYSRNWIPFILRQDLQPIKRTPPRKRNWHFTFTKCAALILLFAILAIGGYSIWYTLTPRVNNTSFPQMAADYGSDDFNSSLGDYKIKHEGTLVEWEAIVADVLSDKYRLRPVASEYADFLVLAKCAADQPVDPHLQGKRVKIVAVIDEVNYLAPILEDTRVVKRLD